MATTEIKTSILLDGEKAFEAALRNVSREIRVNESEMKALKSAYDLTDDKMGNLQQQSNKVKSSMAAQEARVEALTQAVKDAAAKYGEGSEEVDGFSISLNRARADLNRMTKESRELDRQLDELARGADRTGKKLENDLGEGAREASQDIQSMYDSISGKIGDLARTSGLSLAMDIGGKVWDFATGINSFATESREFNRQMSFLETNAKSAGISVDFVKNKFAEVASVTGETDGAVEGLSNLLRTGFDETEMEKAIRGLTGAVIQFPDTLKFESLADGLQETLATGSATGAYAELLERMGVNLDEVNKALEKSKTAEGDQQIVLGYLRGALEKANKEYVAQNQELIEAEASSLNLKQATSELGATFDTWLSPGRNALASVIRGLNDALNDVNYTTLDKILSFVLAPTQTSKGDLEDAAMYNEGTIEAQKAKGIAMPVVHYYPDVEMTAGLDDLDTQMQTAGTDAGASLGDGMAAGLATSSDLVVSVVAATVDQINYELSKVNPISLRYSMGGVAGMTGALSGSGIGAAVIELDGRKVGKAILPYVNQGIVSDVKYRETK